MTAMAVNKVNVNGETVIDLTGDTVIPETLLEGRTAHAANGEVITGTMPMGGSGAQADWNETDPESPAYLKNKPFGEVPCTVTWDGTPAGAPVMRHDYALGDLPWYRVSDLTPDPDGVQDVYVSIVTVEAGTMRYAVKPCLVDGILQFLVPDLGDMYATFVAYKGNGEGLEPGMYVVDISVMDRVLGVTITSVSAGWLSVKAIDQKYLPAALQFGESNFSVSWDGSDTGTTIQDVSGVTLYKVSDATPDAEGISDSLVVLATSVGLAQSFLTPEYAPELRITTFYEYQYSGGLQPVLILYDGNAFGGEPGVYVADLAAMTQALGTPVSGITLSWMALKKIDPIYLPDGSGGVSMEEVRKEIRQYVDQQLGVIANGSY